MRPVPNDEVEAGTVTTRVDGLGSADLGVDDVLRFLAHSSDVVLVVDGGGRMRWASPSIQAVFGYPPERVVGEPVFDFVHPDDTSMISTGFAERVANPGLAPPFRVRMRTFDSSYRRVEVITNNLLDDRSIGAMVVTVRDIEQQIHAESTVRQAEERLRAIVSNAPVVLAAFDSDGILTMVEGQGLAETDVLADRVVGQPVSALFPDRADVEDAMERALAGLNCQLAVEAFGNVWDIRLSPIVEQDRVIGGLLVGTDIVERVGARAAMAVDEERFRSLLQRSTDMALIYRADGVITYASPAVRLFGYTPEDIMGIQPNELCHPDDAEAIADAFLALVARPGATITRELRVKDAFGTWRWIEETFSNQLDDPAVNGIVGNIRDVSERKRVEEELLRLAQFDGLTGLPNRKQFTTRLHEAIDRGRRTGSRVTVVFLDLDKFQLVNDSLGHARGDDLLRIVGERLHDEVRGDDLVARFAGDEFVILCEGGDETLPERVSQRVAGVLSRPVEIDGQSVFVSASIGVAMSPPFDADVLLRNADTAMNRAKERGRDRIEVFDDSLEQEAHQALQLRNELRRALERDQFVLHFQPIMNLEAGTLEGMEALVRWMHPERGMVPPLDFIPAAEESGLIVDLGAWVLREACKEAASLPGEDFHIAVNLSVRQLADQSIVTTVREALEVSGLDPGRLVLEVTESALMANAEMALRCLNDLKALGVRLAIDDFGTGYSSLVYLKRMPVDVIKVDRSFVDGLGDDAEDTAIVSSVIGLAHAVGVQAVAEGVETADQHAHLRGLQCDYAQGYLWSKPLPSADLRRQFFPDVFPPA